MYLVCCSLPGVSVRRGCQNCHNCDRPLPFFFWSCDLERSQQVLKFPLSDEEAPAFFNRTLSYFSVFVSSDSASWWEGNFRMFIRIFSVPTITGNGNSWSEDTKSLSWQTSGSTGQIQLLAKPLKWRFPHLQLFHILAIQLSALVCSYLSYDWWTYADRGVKKLMPSCCNLWVV